MLHPFKVKLSVYSIVALWANNANLLSTCASAACAGWPPSGLDISMHVVFLMLHKKCGPQEFEIERTIVPFNRVGAMFEFEATYVVRYRGSNGNGATDFGPSP